MAEIALLVGGSRFKGWESARVTRSIESIAGTFDLSVTERWADQDQPWPIAEGDECRVYVDGERVIVGRVDRRSLSFGPGQHSISVSGRDAAGALVDCSAILPKWEFANVSVLDLAKKIASPFGISVTLQAGLVLPPTTIPKRFSIDPGDTAFNALEHLCRTAGVLPISDGNGGIVLTRGGFERCTTDLEQGKNILSAESSFDVSNRFRTYLVLGQHRGRDGFSGADSAAVRGSATDETVRDSTRTLVIRPEANVTPASAKKRAEWEAITRAARCDAVTVTVQGWAQNDGTVWPINRLVRVRASLVGINGDLLVTEASYSLTIDGGATTQLKLKRPDSFKPLPTITQASNNYWKEIVKGV